MSTRDGCGWMLALLAVTAACSAAPSSGVSSTARVAPTPVAARAPAAAPPLGVGVAAPTRAQVEDLDPVEPDVIALGEIWSDAPRHASPACPDDALPEQRDASCSRPQGLAALADALDGVSSTEGQTACESPWSAELSAARRAALTTEAQRKRDGRLARLETCAGLDPGLVRLTRVALWTECADALAITVPRGTLTVAMRGYATAARIDRLNFEPPNDFATGPSEKALARAIVWTEGHASVLRVAAAAVATLPAGTHGRAVAQLALGNAWNRLLHTRYDLPRPSPTEQSGPRERLNAELARYVAEATEREASAADAARIATEWPLLRAWQAGQQPGPVEAARALVLPALPRSEARDVRARLAANLPSYVAARLLGDDPLDAAVLRALLERGFDPKLRRTVAAQTPRAGEAQLLAHARVVLAARALAPAQAAAAVELLKGSAVDDAEALSAVASALASLPAGFVSWSSTRALGAPAHALVAASSRSRSAWGAALLGYDAFRLDNASVEPSAGFAATERQARERVSALGPALTSCMPSGFVTNRGCVCPSLGNLY